MSAILTGIGSVLTQAVAWAKTFIGFIADDFAAETGTGIVAIPFALGISLFAIHIAKSAMNR